MRNAFRFALIVLLATAAVVRAEGPAAEPVRLTFGAPRRPIPGDFVGLSFETKRMLAQPYLPDDPARAKAVPPRLFDATDRPLVSFLKTLGVRSVRIGGNTADRATVPLPTTADIDAVFAFAKAADVKVIYTLRLRGTRPADTVEPATYIWNRYADSLSHFEIGNEPDAYFNTYPEFAEAFKQHLTILSAATPGAAYCGPSTTQGHPDWAANVARDVAGPGSRLTLVTQHLYPLGDGKKATAPDAAIDELLSPERQAGYQKLFDRFAEPILQRNVAFRLEETNSYYNGGAPDASNTFASALWALDYLHWWASRGAAGLNFHTSDFFPQTPDGKAVWYVAFAATADRRGYKAMPLAYAMVAFSAARPSRSVAVTAQPQSPALSAYLTQGDNRDLYLTLINRSHGPNAKTFTATLPDGYVASAVLELVAPSVAATEGVTLGSHAIDSLGQWPGKFRPASGSSLTLVPVSAAVWRVAAVAR